jgi:hypothetical protein
MPPPAPIPPPWEDHARFGWIQGYLLTVRLIFTRPTATFARMPRRGGTGLQVLYVIVTAMIVQAFSLAWSALFAPLATVFERTTDFPYHLFGTVGSEVLALALMPVIAPLALVVGSGITHVCLMLAGGAHEGYEATLRGGAYAWTVSLVGIFPICGSLVAWGWSIVVSVIALRELHGTTTGRAALAVILPALICCSLLCAGIVAFGGMAWLRGLGDAMGR